MSSVDERSHNDMMDDNIDYRIVDDLLSTTRDSSTMDQPRNKAQLLIGVPKGLPVEMRLTLDDFVETKTGEQRPAVSYIVWANAMRRLFRAHGVLEIMKDVVDPGARAARQRDSTGNAPRKIPARLDVWDHSDAMTALLRADALINDSITQQVADWIAVRSGTENPHEKWEAIRGWFEPEIEAKLEAMRNVFAQIDFGLFNSVQEYVDEFMRQRADLLANGIEYSDLDYKRGLIKGCASHMPALEARMEKRMKERETGAKRSNVTAMCRFATDFVKEASPMWDDIKRAELNARRQERRRYGR